MWIHTLKNVCLKKKRKLLCIGAAITYYILRIQWNVLRFCIRNKQKKSIFHFVFYLNKNLHWIALKKSFQCKSHLVIYRRFFKFFSEIKTVFFLSSKWLLINDKLFEDINNYIIRKKNFLEDFCNNLFWLFELFTDFIRRQINFVKTIFCH